MFTDIFFMGERKERESFYSCIVMGRHVKIIGISENTVRVSYMIVDPGFIKREWQHIVYIIVHKF